MFKKKSKENLPPGFKHVGVSLTKLDNIYLNYKCFLADHIYPSLFLTILYMGSMLYLFLIVWGISAYFLGFEHSFDILAVYFVFYLWVSWGCKKRLKKINKR